MKMMRLVLWALVAGVAADFMARSGSGQLQAVQLRADEGVSDSHQHSVSSQPPVPTTTRCIVILCVQYMLVVTALAACRTYKEFSGASTEKFSVLYSSLEQSAQTLTYAPMICVLFIACRMRVEFLSDGKDQPQVWVQKCMFGLTFSVVASTLVVLVTPLLTGRPAKLKPGEFEPMHESDGNLTVFYTMNGIRYAILFGIYIGLAGVILGINLYMPAGTNSLADLPPPAPAVMCTMILCVFFFGIQLVIAACQTYEEFSRVEMPKVIGVMKGAALTVEFAPMLAILFLAARMRALQHDGQPQPWAQKCMYAATFSMCATTIFAILVPALMGGNIEMHPQTRVLQFENVDSHPMLANMLEACRYACILGFYGGAVGVIYSIFTFVAPAGPQATQPVSPTVHCVVNLTCQFFFVYFMMTVMTTIKELSGRQMHSSRFFDALEAAKSTMSLAPMLAILFVTTRMYALVLTDKKGAPQSYVQDGMYMATWSILISFISCLVTGFIMEEGKELKTDADGNPTTEISNEYAAYALTAVRYLSLLLLYGGIVTVIVGLFTMTPENATGRGSIPSYAPPGAANVAPAGNNF